MMSFFVPVGGRASGTGGTAVAGAVQRSGGGPVVRWLAVAGLVAVLAACASIPQPDETVALPPQWLNAVGTTAMAQGDEPVPQPVDSWWQELGDAGLDAYVKTVLQASPQARAGGERLRAAEARAGAAGVQFRPQLRAGTRDALDPGAGKSFFVGGLDASWELPLFGRAQAERQAAQAAVDEARAELAVIQQALVGQAVEHWLQLAAATRVLALHERQLQLRNEQADKLKLRVRLRLDAASATYDAEAAASEAEMALTEARLAVLDRRHQMAALAGMARPDSGWRPAAGTLAIGARPLPGAGVLPAQWLQRSPALALARARIGMAQGRAGTAEAAQYPSVGLSASLLWATHVTAWRHDQDHGWFSLGPFVDIPLFDWGARKAAAVASGHELQAAAWAYQQAAMDGFAQVERAFAALGARRQQVQQAARLLAAREQAVNAAGQRVRQGLQSPLAEINGQLQRVQAQGVEVQARLAAALAWARLQSVISGAVPVAGNLP